MPVDKAVSKRMKACKSKDSSIELALRRAMWAAGYRYRVNHAKLPGKPDIVLTRAKIAIFCDGEFWHGRDWERRQHDFKANKEFWVAKIERNMRRADEVNEELAAMGWRVLRFWERDIKKKVEECLSIVHQAVQASDAENSRVGSAQGSSTSG